MLNYGTSPADVDTDRYGNALGDRVLRVYSARNSGVELPILDQDGNPLAELRTDENGRYPFKIDSDQWPTPAIQSPSGEWWDVAAAETPQRAWAAYRATEKLSTRVTDLENNRSMQVPLKAFGPIGGSDDTATVQHALDELHDVGGGDVLFPPGLFLVAGDAPLQLRDNVKLRGFGTTLRKASTDFYSMFVSLSQGQTGYGSGCRNVEVSGFTIRGKFGTGSDRMSIGVFSLHHAEGVTVHDMIFDQCQQGGHTFDLGGCRSVRIFRNDFIGFDPQFETSAECIQTDISYRGSVSYPDADGSYDGLMTTGVWVDQNRFLPTVVDGTAYPCPNPIGGHAAIENGYVDDVWFTRNLVQDWNTQTGDDLHNGVIHIPSPRGWHILDNTFRQTVAARKGRIISLLAPTSGYRSDANWNVAGQPQSTFTAPNSSKSIDIRGNIIDRPDADPAPVVTLINDIHGGVVAGNIAENHATLLTGGTKISKVGNVSSAGSDVPVVPNVPPTPIRSTQTADQTVNNSTVMVDSGLAVALDPNSVYEVDAFLAYFATTSGDFKVGWSGPAGASMLWTLAGIAPAATTYAYAVQMSYGLGDTPNSGGNAADVVARPSGRIKTGSSGGTLKLRFAQNTAEATDATLRAGSWLRAVKVG